MITVTDLDNGMFGDETDFTPTKFPDGTKMMKYYPHEGGKYAITWLYDDDSELFQLIALTKHLRQNFAKRIYLDLPYIPNARMDRTKNKDEVFTLKWFADTINWLGFDGVTVCNPHSTVSEALFDRCKVDFESVLDHVMGIVHNLDPKIDVLYFPDAGAEKRYGAALSVLGLPTAFGNKNRDWKTGKILGITVEAGGLDLKGKNILMVDDICAYGGTFYYSALRLKELGANEISCYVTHLENSVLDPEKGKLLKGDLIKKIYATNDIFRGKHEKIEIVEDYLHGKDE